MSSDQTFIDQTIARIGRTPDATIPILQALQDHYGYLPKEALQRVCETTDITPAGITGVATFYDMFRHEPVGKHIVHICHGTACHVAGAERAEEALRRNLKIPGGTHTDAERKFTIERVACLGCCTLAPVVRIDEETIGYATAEKMPAAVQDFLNHVGASASAKPCESDPKRPTDAGEVHICLDSCCAAKGTEKVFRAFQESAAKSGVAVRVKRVTCPGACYRTPMIEVVTPGKPRVAYVGLTPDETGDVLKAHFTPDGIRQRSPQLTAKAADSVRLDDGPGVQAGAARDERDPGLKAFFQRQVHIAMEHYGWMEPLDLDEFMAHDGFAGLRRCLKELSPEQIIETMEKSGLRGRGGAGFPTGQKWRIVRKQPGDVKYVICNGDEGDPGAFMDRMILESFPYRVIEGLAIASLAVGAHDVVFYIRHEYPNALRRVRAALAELERRGMIGERLLGFDYALRFSIKEGAGAFVCGEETALIASVEGKRGMPRLRPPFPAQSGLWGKPTLINNVETLAMIPWIIRNGAEEFAAMGTATSKGTKVFALAGKIRRAGLIEIPMGTTLREIVEDIGGGVLAGRKFKAVQMGGPSGGCVPARLTDTPVDYESLRNIGAIMGSGGMVVLDDTACMVDIARYFLQFTQNQSCGKCAFCRIGTKRMLELLNRFCAGTATPKHLAELEALAPQVTAGSLCGLGKTAPNPVLTTLRYFRDEYEAHLHGRCPAGKCTALIKYVINENCTGCSICADDCPVNAIPVTPGEIHTIDLNLCTRCDTCRQVCPSDAIEVK